MLLFSQWDVHTEEWLPLHLILDALMAWIIIQALAGNAKAGGIERAPILPLAVPQLPKVEGGLLFPTPPSPHLTCCPFLGSTEKVREMKQSSSHQSHSAEGRSARRELAPWPVCPSFPRRAHGNESACRGAWRRAPTAFLKFSLLLRHSISAPNNPHPFVFLSFDKTNKTISNVCSALSYLRCVTLSKLVVLWLWDLRVKFDSNCWESVGVLNKKVTVTVVQAREAPVNTSQDRKHKVPWI